MLIKDMKFMKLYLPVLIITYSLIVSFSGCSSGEFEIEETEIQYNEKIVKVDTINKISDTIVKNIDSSKIITEQKEDNVTVDKYIYTVQVGAFMIPSNCEKFFARAKSVLGLDVFTIQSDNLCKIRIGNFKNKSDALRFLDQVRNMGFSDAFYISVKQ